MFQDYTVLLVEDDAVMQQIIKLLLQDKCKKLYFANNGVEGLEQYKLHKQDVVITDLNMPLMNGIVMSKEIKEHDFLQPIILLTAYGDIKELQEAINIGVNAFLSKPIADKEVLFNTIKKLLNYSTKLKKGTKVQCEDELKATGLLNDLLHDNQEYIDYETMVKDVT